MLGFGLDLLEFSDGLTKSSHNVHQAKNKQLERLSRLICEISQLSVLRFLTIFLMYAFGFCDFIPSRFLQMALVENMKLLKFYLILLNPLN